MNFWQNLPQHIDPVLIEIGGFGIRWYSLGYIVAFIIIYYLTKYRVKTEEPFKIYTPKLVEDALVYIILGVILGARLGYCVFYEPLEYLPRPWTIFMPFSFEGGFHITGISGMSYHGGVIGVAVAFFIFAKKNKIKMLHFLEMFVPSIPIGYMFGRIGNFMNGELYGRVTEVPWGMYFYEMVYTRSGEAVKKVFTELRHPSQLYEALGEGLLLFILLWSVRRKHTQPGLLAGLYLIGYGVARFIVEFFRKPDDLFKSAGQSLGTVIGIFSMGQVLCIGMILAGIIVIKINQKKVK